VFLGSTLAHYAGMLEAAQAAGGPVPHLVIGPWAHNNVTGALGDEYFGLDSGISMIGADLDLTHQHVRWFDAHLKGRREALDGVAPVRVFVMGSNHWRDLETFPPPETAPAKWYLHPGGGLAPDSPDESAPSTYVYDPRDPVPTIGGATLLPPPDPPGPMDQSPNDHRTDILRFDSAVLDEPLTLLGRVEVRLFAATSAPDTDFVARLVDVLPDGRKLCVTDGIIRGRARETFRSGGEIRRVAPTLVQPGQPYEYTIDLWATARTFFAGHRIRVEITSSSFPRWDRNLNTGHDPFTDTEMQVAEQRVYHSPALQSHIVLPVYHGRG
jgi:putative CocE/NonD family hydrolase